MTEPVQLIRNALAAFESADSYREDKEAVCNFHDALTRPIVIALLARLDAANIDAARYRWLRHGDNDENIIAYPDEADTGSWLLRNKELDAAIDAAMKGNL